MVLVLRNVFCAVQERRIAEKQIEMAKQVSRELYRLLEGQKA
eukprot:COSAG06_NODE_45682_length_353_cov_0.429134_1_plen_41_part_10